MSSSRKYFKCSDRERAAFEAGIKLASLYHQYIGSPVSPESAAFLERAMERGMMTQPYVIEADVSIDPGELSSSVSRYGYCSLNERMLRAKVTVGYGGFTVRATLEWIDELNYPLMRIDGIDQP